MSTTSIHKIITICPLLACPSYDGIIATVKNNRVTRLDGDEDHPWTKGHICTKGGHEWQTLYHPQHFRQPLLKTASGRKEISWEQEYINGLNSIFCRASSINMVIAC